MSNLDHPCPRCPAQSVGFTKTGNVRAICQPCARLKDKIKYRKHKERIKVQRKTHKSRRNKVQVYLDFMKVKPCSDCQGTFPPYVMDFHHLDPKDKSNTVSRMVRSHKSIEAILEEVSKCVLVCANCHRIREHS